MEFDNPVNTLHCDVLYLSKRFLQSSNVFKCKIYQYSRLNSYINAASQMLYFSRMLILLNIYLLFKLIKPDRGFTQTVD